MDETDAESRFKLVKACKHQYNLYPNRHVAQLVRAPP